MTGSPINAARRLTIARPRPSPSSGRASAQRRRAPGRTPRRCAPARRQRCPARCPTPAARGGQRRARGRRRGPRRRPCSGSRWPVRLRRMRSTISGSAWTRCWAPWKRSARPFVERRRFEVKTQPAKDVADRRPRPDLDAAAVDAGDVEQLREQALQRIHRVVDAVDEPRHLGVVAALAQRPGEQTLSRAAAGAGRGSRRRRTASSPGWRPWPAGALPSAISFSARSCSVSASPSQRSRSTRSKASPR